MALNGFWDTRIEATAYGCFIPGDILDHPVHGPAVWEFFNGYNRWPNFHYEELRSKGNGDLRTHYETLDALQRLRVSLGRAVPVSSYYRDPAYNASVGGAEDSYHLLGRAIDTPILNTHLGRFKLWHHATKAGFKAIGVYATFTHIDTGPERYWID